MVPVTVNDKVYAYLVVSQNHEPLSGLNLTIIENACTICALEIMRFKASLEVERRFRSNFIQDLVSGNFASHQVMIRQAESFGWDLSRPHVLLNIDFDGFETYYVDLTTTILQFEPLRTALFRSSSLFPQSAIANSLAPIGAIA